MDFLFRQFRIHIHQFRENGLCILTTHEETDRLSTGISGVRNDDIFSTAHVFKNPRLSVFVKFEKYYFQR